MFTPRRPLATALLSVLIASAPLAAMAQAPDVPTSASSAPRASSGILSLIPEPARSDHTITVGGETLAYSAEAGTLGLKDGKGDVTAEVFYTAYIRAEATPDRPVTFVFNGGPGAASAYLHLGAMGPRVLATAPNGDFLPPPSRLIYNPDTWLDRTDLVFIDPPGTGYSRAPTGDDEARFWGVQADARAMGAFIRLWLQQANRMASPVVLAGESYGGFRAALLAKTLQEDVGITPSAAILISPALEFAMLYGDAFLPITHAVELPGFAAVHLERQGLKGEALAARLQEVERYALGPYLQAIAGGLESGGTATSEEVAKLTGLDPRIVRENHGRVPVSVFIREYERRDGTILSRYDGGISGPATDPRGFSPDGPDAVLDRSVPALTSAFVAYVRDELGFKTELTYRLLNGEIASRWDYGTSPSRQGFAGVLDDLQQARALNPRLKVLVAHGATDLVTPYFSSKYLLSQLPTLARAEPIDLKVYEGGHMMYLRPDSRKALKADAAALYDGLDRPGN